MLHLLGVPEWRLADGVTRRLPASLPTCLLVYLACHGRWLERETLADLFWPDRAPEDARHNLRVNLHRVRQLLAEGGRSQALQSERTRVCLRLPLDLDALGAAMDATDGAALLQLCPEGWLDGFQVAGFEGFWSWARTFGTQLQRRWRLASERALQSHLATKLSSIRTVAASPPPWVQALQRLLHVGQDAPDEDTSAVAAAPLLFGRHETLHRLRQPAARAMVLTGEAGMGKSSLLSTAFPRSPLLQGGEGLTQIPYRPVAKYLLAQMVTLRRLIQARGSGVAAYRLDLARLLPELAPHDPLPPLDMLTAKSRLLEGLARVFETIGECLLVDDLQWCDHATLELLTLLTHRGALCWRGAARGHELSDTQRHWLQQLEQTGHLTLLPLTGLDLPAVAQCCRQYAPQQAWCEADIAQLHASSTGNPFVLGELVRARALGAPDGDDPPGANLPRRVRELLQRRLRTLAPPARALVEAASVVMRPLPLSVLAQVADWSSMLSDVAQFAAAECAINAE